MGGLSKGLREGTRKAGQGEPPDERNPAMMVPVLVFGSFLVGLGGARGWALFVPHTSLGPEFQVNTYTTSAQNSPVVAADGAGNFVVVWASPHDGSGSGVFGQRYDSSGTPLGSEFPVNTY